MPPRATWTGAQHSLLRALFGLWLAWHLGRQAVDLPSAWRLYPWADELGADPSLWSLRLVLATGCLAALAFAAGLRARWCALLLAALCLEHGSLVFGGWGVLTLLAFALHPEGPNAPYGSWDARGRVDPRGSAGGWQRPPGLSFALLFLLAAYNGLEGLMELGVSAWRDGSALGTMSRVAGSLSPLLEALPEGLWPLLATVFVAVHLAFLPALLFPRAHPWIWLAGLVVVLLWSLPFFPPAAFFYLLAFDPGWLAPRPAAPEGGETIFYDGDCGLCHRAVRFVLAEDSGGRFAFAPLASAAFAAHGADARALGDTMVLERADGTLAARSEAWVGILRGLGGGWRAVGELLRLVPRPLRDRVYDGIASVRKRLFAKPDGACPLLPRDLAQRFRA